MGRNGGGRGVDDVKRCGWGNGPDMGDYHDVEWGVPVTRDRALFELLSLEGAQAGLSWRTVLRRRPHYRRIFEGFDIEAVSQWTPTQVDKALQDEGIIRHRGKVASVVGNARAIADIIATRGSFATYLWDFVDGVPQVGNWSRDDMVPATTPLSLKVSGDLKQKGCVFVGPTIVYSFLQSAGLVMDHVTSCFRFSELAAAQPSWEQPSERVRSQR